MNTIYKRFFLFLGLCIPARLLIAYVAKYLATLSTKLYLKLWGILLLIPAFGFLYIYSNNLRTTGLEVFGEKIWWNKLRPIHALNYIMFTILAFSNNKQFYLNAWLILLFDVIIGLLAFFIYHFFS